MKTTEKTDTMGLLFPAYQKLYSALNNLEKFEKGSNFFDNISYLDNFFSEYRNVTFMLQKSLSHSEYLKVYEKNREKYLFNDVCKWFIEKRNEVLKQQPFELEKKIRIVIYTANENLALPELSYTIENDVEYSSLIDSMKEFLASLKLLEVMFSAEFSFYEKGQSKELYDNIISGINNMKLFMKAMKDDLNDNSLLATQLEEKINALNFHRIPKNMLLTDDYIFYSRKNIFERASRSELYLGLDNPKIQLSRYEAMFSGPNDMFVRFIMHHVFIFQKQRVIMPTCFITFNDQTMQFMSFESSIKTTVYRKLNEIANRIETEGIVGVYYVGEMYNYQNVEQILNLESRERVKYKSSESLMFFECKLDGTLRSYSFESEKIDDDIYIASILRENDKKHNNIAFMNPVINEFKRINQIN